MKLALFDYADCESASDYVLVTFSAVYLAALMLGVFALIFVGVDHMVAKRVTAQGKITSVSFAPEHRHCSKVCHTVPDRWYLGVSTPNGEDVMTLYHAPWDWEKAGTPVLVTYDKLPLSGGIDVQTVAVP